MDDLKNAHHSCAKTQFFVWISIKSFKECCKHAIWANKSCVAVLKSDMGLDFDIEDYVKSQKNTDPPYKCGVSSCDKTYRFVVFGHF